MKAFHFHLRREKRYDEDGIEVIPEWREKLWNPETIKITGILVVIIPAFIMLAYVRDLTYGVVDWSGMGAFLNIALPLLAMWFAVRELMLESKNADLYYAKKLRKHTIVTVRAVYPKDSKEEALDEWGNTPQTPGVNMLYTLLSRRRALDLQDAVFLNVPDDIGELVLKTAASCKEEDLDEEIKKALTKYEIEVEVESKVPVMAEKETTEVVDGKEVIKKVKIPVMEEVEEDVPSVDGSPTKKKVTRPKFIVEKRKEKRPFKFEAGGNAPDGLDHYFYRVPIKKPLYYIDKLSDEVMSVPDPIIHMTMKIEQAIGKIPTTLVQNNRFIEHGDTDDIKLAYKRTVLVDQVIYNLTDSRGITENDLKTAIPDDVLDHGALKTVISQYFLIKNSITTLEQSRQELQEANEGLMEKITEHGGLNLWGKDPMDAMQKAHQRGKNRLAPNTEERPVFWFFVVVSWAMLVVVLALSWAGVI